MSSGHPNVLRRERSVLLVIDVQESYRGKLFEEDRLVEAAARLLRAAEILGIPVVLTEQYPKGLGATREEVARHVPEDARRFEKTAFSALAAPGLRDHLRELGRDQVVVAGIETHVCVSQSVHDCLAAQLQPHLARDAITARFALEDQAGFDKMTRSGALPASTEAILFEWLRDARDPDFKAVHKLVV